MKPYREPRWTLKQLQPMLRLKPNEVMRLRLEHEYIINANEAIYIERVHAFIAMLHAVEEIFGPSNFRILWLRAHPPEKPPVYDFQRFLLRWLKETRSRVRPPQVRRRKGLDKPTETVVR